MLYDKNSGSKIEFFISILTLINLDRASKQFGPSSMCRRPWNPYLETKYIFDNSSYPLPKNRSIIIHRNVCITRKEASGTLKLYIRLMSEILNRLSNSCLWAGLYVCVSVCCWHSPDHKNEDIHFKFSKKNWKFLVANWSEHTPALMRKLSKNSVSLRKNLFTSNKLWKVKLATYTLWKAMSTQSYKSLNFFPHFFGVLCLDIIR